MSWRLIRMLASKIASLGMALALVTIAAAQESTASPAPPQLTATEVIHNLETHNQARADALREFEGTRTYTLHHRGFPKSLDAEMVVQLDYRAPSSKEFKVISQSGSKFIQDRVFKRMIESEREAAKDQDHNALNEANYSFELEGLEHSDQGDRYVLKVSPRTKNKFLYRGKIWVDAADFAVVKIEGEPAQNPSFFIKKTEVQHRYQKVGDFWLPAENHTVSYLRFGGHAELSIEYQSYKIVSADPIRRVQSTAQDIVPVQTLDPLGSHP